MSSLALFKTSLSKVSEGNRLFVRWAAGGAYWWALFLWLPVGCHPFWTSSLARYLPSICLSFAFRLSRERQHISRKLGLADVPCPLFARPIDTHPYIHTHIYAARTGCPHRQGRQSEAPERQTQSATKNEADRRGQWRRLRARLGELPSRHDRHRRDEVRPRHHCPSTRRTSGSARLVCVTPTNKPPFFGQHFNLAGRYAAEPSRNPMVSSRS